MRDNVKIVKRKRKIIYLEGDQNPQKVTVVPYIIKGILRL